ncbi:MAG TPA: anti-sigma factor, partial [Plasticicumulans sp.]|uniref:anti-sigma factor n=1 Tax=Plasticicumulans sp. TaxID=2307179 RepID=UPI002BE98911
MNDRHEPAGYPDPDAALPPAPDDPERLLLHADLDGELDPAASLALARRRAADPAFAAEAERIAALHRALSRISTEHGPSAALRARLAQPWAQAAADVPVTSPVTAPVTPLPAAQTRTRRRGWHSDWRALAASCLLSAGLVYGSAALYFAPDAQQAQIAATVAGHRRALLAQHPVDVASSDRHTVKPWLGSRLALAPTVIDLAAGGYPLLGARIEIVDGRPAPTLVYGHREHLISLSLIPVGSREESSPELSTVDGYGVLRWQHAGMAHVAV